MGDLDEAPGEPPEAGGRVAGPARLPAAPRLTGSPETWNLS